MTAVSSGVSGRGCQGLCDRCRAVPKPSADLQAVQDAGAHFNRLLGGLGDNDLNIASPVSGLTRRHIVAAIGLQARALAGLVADVRTCASPHQRITIPLAGDAALAATLPREALRHLFVHAQRHLQAEWDALTDAQWRRMVFGHDGRPIRLRDTPLAWAWIVLGAANDLGLEIGAPYLTRDLGADRASELSQALQRLTV